jgi:hypothetical protein
MSKKQLTDENNTNVKNNAVPKGLKLNNNNIIDNNNKKKSRRCC